MIDSKGCWILIFYIILFGVVVFLFFKKDNKVYFKGLSIEFVDSNRTMLKVDEYYSNGDKSVFLVLQFVQRDIWLLNLMKMVIFFMMLMNLRGFGTQTKYLNCVVNIIFVN